MKRDSYYHPRGVKAILSGMTKEQRLRALLLVCREIAKGRKPVSQPGGKKS